MSDISGAVKIDLQNCESKNFIIEFVEDDGIYRLDISPEFVPVIMKALQKGFQATNVKLEFRIK